MQNDPYTYIGRFVKAHGIKGLLIAELNFGDGNWPESPLIYTQDPYFGFKPLRLDNATYRENKSGFTFFVQLEGILDRQAAEKLVHTKIFVESSIADDFISLNSTDVQWVDFSVLDEKGQLCAIVTDSYFNGDHELLLIKDLNSDSEPFWFPLVEDYIISIDEQKEEIQVSDYQQFFELNAK